jgi:hypothetical protein
LYVSSHFESSILSYSKVVQLQVKKLSRPSECGTLATYLYAATYASDEPFELQGKYLTQPSRIEETSQASRDEMTQQEMWNFCDKIIRGYLTPCE